MDRHFDAIGAESDAASRRIEAEAFEGICTSLGWVFLVSGGVALVLAFRRVPHHEAAAA